MRAGKLKSLFIAAASLSAAGCSHLPAPDFVPKSALSARETLLKEPVPPAPIPERLFIDAANYEAPASLNKHKPRKDAIRITFGSYSEGPPGFLAFCDRLPKECVQVPDNGLVKETPALLDLVSKANIKANHEIEPVSDLTQYGEEERWTYPDSGQGDCEDYVLLKRRHLIAQGVPPEALLIATVTTKAGEGHAILVLRTDKNDYVLNNLTDAVLPWTETDFKTWRMIESPGNPFVWRTLRIEKRKPPLSGNLALSQQQDAPRQAVKADGGDDVTRGAFKPVVVKPL